MDDAKWISMSPARRRLLMEIEKSNHGNIIRGESPLAPFLLTIGFIITLGLLFWIVYRVIVERTVL